MPDTPISTETLWELLSDKLRGFLVRHVSDEQVAEDLLQETFVRIHQGLDGLAGEQRLTAWVFQIARNLAIDHQRSRGTGFREEDDADVVELSEADDEGNLNAVVQSWLPPMIGQLPEPQRQAVELYELENISQQEIADRLGISLSGAKSRIQRGRAKLKALLFDCCSFERDRRGNVIGFTKNGPAECRGCEGD